MSGPDERDGTRPDRLTCVERHRHTRSLRLMTSPKHRFLQHVAELTAGRGWSLRQTRALLFRSFEGGEHRVAFQLHGKYALWSGTTVFQTAVFSPQEFVAKAEGRSGSKSGFMAHHFLDRRHYHPSGNIWRLQLYKPGLDVPPKDEFDALGVSLADFLNPDDTVRAAAERAAWIVENHAEPWFAGEGSPTALAEVALRGDPNEIRALSPPEAAHKWIAWAWMLDPDRGQELLARRQAAIEGMHPTAAAIEREKVRGLESALRTLGEPGGSS